MQCWISFVYLQVVAIVIPGIEMRYHIDKSGIIRFSINDTLLYCAGTD